MATPDELKQLFHLQEETLSTEFKAWLDLATPEGRANLAKASIALANHGGGAIIMGMAGKPPASTERPPAIPRYTSDAVNAAVNKYADPQVHCEVMHLNHPSSGHEHAFVVVPGPHGIPVMSKKDLQGVIASNKAYIRKPGPKSEEPFTADEWRTLFAQNMQANRDMMLESVRNVFYGLSTASKAPVDRLQEFAEESRAKWEKLIEGLPVTDVARMPHGHYDFTFEIVGVPPAKSLMELNRRIEKAAEVRHTGWSPFVIIQRPPIAPAAVEGVIQTWLGTPKETGRSTNNVDFWRAHPDGRLFQMRAYDEDVRDRFEPGKVFSVTTPIWRLGDALLFVARLAREWDENNPTILFKLEYHGLKGRELRVIDPNRAPLSYPRFSQTETVVVRGEATTSQILDNTDEVLKGALAPLYEAFDFFVLPFQVIVQEVADLKAGRF